MYCRSSRFAGGRLLVGLALSCVLGLAALLVFGVVLEGESGSLFEVGDSGSSTVTPGAAGAVDGGVAGGGVAGGGVAGGGVVGGGVVGGDVAGGDVAGGAGRPGVALGDGRPRVAPVDGEHAANVVEGSFDPVGLPPVQPIGLGSGLGFGAGAGAVDSGGGDGDADDKPAVEGAGIYRARVLDAITGHGVSGVRVRLTSYHGDVHLADAGVPMIDVQLATTGSDGSFRFVCPDPQDPQLELHVETTHARFESVVFVLHRRDGVRGCWRQVEARADAPDAVWLLGRHEGDSGVEEIEVHLRRAETVPVRVVDRAGRGLAYAPVRVIPRRDSHTFLEEEEPPAIARNGRLVRVGEPRILHTGPRGYLWIPFGEYPYSFEILHPDYYLYDRDPRTGEEIFTTIVRDLPYTEEVLLEARSDWRERHQLVDTGLVPIAGAEIEIALEGMVPLRVITDAEGWFQVGVQPFARDAPWPLSLVHPRRGRLTVLSPGFRNRAVDIVLPLASRQIRLEARPQQRLTFRTVVGEESGTKAIPAKGLRTTLDSLTPVRVDFDGRVELIGDLPATGELFGVVVSGYLPLTVEMPDTGVRERDVDLGDLIFEEGWTKEVHITGADATALRSARVFVTCVDERLQAFPDLEQHRYEPGVDGVVRVRALRRGSYLVGVEGAMLSALSRGLEIFEEDLDRPFEMPVDLSSEETVIVRGSVGGLTPRQADGMQVIERFRVRGVASPLTMPPYPLSTDGRFGSVRRLAGVVASHVSVISATEKAADGVLARGDGDDPVFSMGELRVRRFPHARLSFTSPHLGEVYPPRWLAIEGEDGNETFARPRLRGFELLIDNLRNGRYVLRWKTPAGLSGSFSRDESFLIQVENRFGGAVVGTVERRAGFRELITVRVTDVDGQEVPGVRSLQTESVPGSGFGYADVEIRRRLQEDPTLQAVMVSSGQPTMFEFVADGYLRTRVEVPVGEEIPRELVMCREGNSLRARVLDTDGELFDGFLETSWKPLTSSPIQLGDPILSRVDSGRLMLTNLPSLPMRYTFRVKDSSDSTTRKLTIVDDGEADDIGKIRLGATRVIRGVVLFVDGSPAKGATVAVVPRDTAHRYPIREPIDFTRHPHKTTTNIQGDFELDGLPLELSADQVLVAHLEGLVNAVEEPINFGLLSHGLHLFEPNRLTLEVGYDNDVRRERYRFDLEYQEDPDDPQTRLSLGEVPADILGLSEYTNVRPGVYRVAWRLRNEYAALPPVWEDVDVPPGGVGSLRFVVEGVVLRGAAMFNGRPVKRGWIVLTHDPGLNGGARVGRIVDGEFELIDPPDALRAYVAVMPEESPQPQQNIARGEALPREIPGYRASLRAGRLDVDYHAYDVEIRFSERFLSRNPEARLTYDHHDWDGRTFDRRPATMAIESTRLVFRMMRKGPYRFTVRNERGSLLRNFAGVVRDDDVTLIVR